MRLLVRLLRRFAVERDRNLLQDSPGLLTYARVTARIALRYLWFYLGALAFLLVYFTVSGMDVYHRTEMPAFCGTCHEMGNNLRSWQASTHGQITCIECHARPGLFGYAQAKIGGIRQLVKHLSSESIEEIRMGDSDREIVSENCLRCHAGASRLEERAGIAISHSVHLKAGVSCVDCHSGRFAHPEPDDVKLLATKNVGLASHADCFGCHDGKHEIAANLVFDAREEPSCKRCHPDSGAVYDHGGKPWKDEDRECLSCHDAKATDSHFALKGKSEKELCSRCHEQLSTATYTSQHKPFKDGECHECHRVMSPLNLFGGGPAPTTAFCYSCHEDLQLRVQNKPVKAKVRFAADGKDLHRKHAKFFEDDPAWCRNCHSGHGSNAPRAFIQLRNENGDVDGAFEATATGGSCTGECHQEAAEYDVPGAEGSAGGTGEASP